MQISIGMALVRGAGALISYLLRDEFITDRAAGAVNGTAAEPGPGTRTVTDGNSKLSIASGLLTFATDGVGAGNPGLWYAGITRISGRVFLAAVIPASTSSQAGPGWDTAQSGGPTDAFRFNSASVLSIMYLGTTLAIGSYSAGTTYPLAVILRATGSFYFAKISSIWQLVWVSDVGNTATMFPTLTTVGSGTTSVYSADYIRVPTDLWLPTPLCSDGFASAFGVSDGAGHAEGVAGGIGAGGSGLTWTGATWSMSGAKAINTPGLGSELLTNTEFATDTTGWSALNGATLTRRDFTSSPDIDPTGGSDNFGLEVASGGLNSSAARQAPTLVTGAWYQVQARLFSPSGNTAVNAALLAAVNPAAEVKVAPVEDAWQAILVSGRATGTTGDVRLRCLSSTAGDKAYFDAPSLKVLTLADLFASVSVSTADVVADVNVVVTAGTQAGLVLNLDSTSSPANFIIAYHDGTNCKLEKCVAGVYTTVITAAATYSAGATLRVTKIGTAYRLYYNSALVGSGTISDAGIISNLRAGLFSTYDQNSLDNFVLYASGSEGQYAILDSY